MSLPPGCYGLTIHQAASVLSLPREEALAVLTRNRVRLLEEGWDADAVRELAEIRRRRKEQER